MSKELAIRFWRVVYVKGGAMVFVDPTREHVRLFEGAHPEQWRHAPTDRTDEELHGWVQGSLFEEDFHREA